MEDMESWLSPTRGIQLQLRSFLESAPAVPVVLIVLNTQNHNSVVSELLKVWKSSPLTYFTLNQSAEDVLSRLKQEPLPLEKMQFIDAVSLASGRKPAKLKNVEYLESPSDLLDISAALLKATAKKQGVVVFDSVSTLLLYNKPEAVEKFIHSLVNKFKSQKTGCAFVMVQSSEQRRTIENVSQFVDRVIPVL
ncbi:MAG: hypothetical protein V1847_01675 [Candidatus Diapherotrites archaeon]